MRLTCPNCGAQYEVPDEVIPTEGRDVQCSNCGTTWFQTHPDQEVVAEDDAADEILDTDPDPGDLRAALTGDGGAADADDGDDAGDAAPASEVAAARAVDPAVSGILREEAEREARLRAGESDNLESQPDLGLDSYPGDESDRRAREARDRMSRMRGEDPDTNDLSGDAGSRRGLLPDIEEINSTLRNSGEKPTHATPSTEVRRPTPPKPRRSSFLRGVSVAVIVGVALMLLYLNAARVTGWVPQAEPMLTAYVALVDQARVWLDAQIAGLLIPDPPE